MEYLASSGKPNFCSSCGQPLGPVGKATKASQQSSIPEGDHGDEDTNEITEVPHLTELEFDLIEPSKMDTVSMGQVFKAAEMSDSRPQRDPSKNTKVSKKKILDQLKAESSAIRPKGSSDN